MIDVSTNYSLIIKQLPNKSSSLDPIHTWLLKECVEEILPIITTFVHRLTREGTVPKALKHALVTPISRKIAWIKIPSAISGGI